MTTFQPSEYSSYGSPQVPQKIDVRVAPLGAAAVVGVIGAAAIVPLLVGPWVFKQFKPDWGYGKRVAATLGVGFGVGAVTGVARAASGAKNAQPHR